MNGDQAMRAHSAALPAPEFANPAFVKPVPLHQARVAIVTSAAIHKSDDERFSAGDTGYRVCPNNPDGYQECTCSTSGTWGSCTPGCIL